MPRFDLGESFQKSDAAALTWSQKNLRPPGSEKVVAFLANDYAPFVLLPIVLVWIARGGARAVRLALVALAMVTVTMALRSLVIAALLPRLPPSGTGASSFPSTAAANAFALGTFFSLYYLRHAPWIFFAMLAFAAAPVATGNCWPSDAVAGAVLGLVLGYFFWAVTRGNVGRLETFAATGGVLDERAANRMSRR